MQLHFQRPFATRKPSWRSSAKVCESCPAEDSARKQG